jgi:hypothetical protein
MNQRPNQFLTLLVCLVITCAAPTLAIKSFFPHVRLGGVDPFGLFIILGFCGLWLKQPRPITWRAFLTIVGLALVVGPSLFPIRHISLVIGGAGLWLLLFVFMGWALPRALRHGPMGLLLAFFLLYPLIGYFGATLLFLAAGGNISFHAILNENPVDWSAGALLLAIVPLCVLLLPERLRAKLPFEHQPAKVRGLVLVVSTLIALAATTADLYIQHLFHGPLASMQHDQLAAILVLFSMGIASLYCFTARSVWQYGLANLFNPGTWRPAATTVIRALRAEPKSPPDEGRHDRLPV